MTNLFDPPDVRELPLSLGRDLRVDFQQRIDGAFTAYDEGVTVTLEIDVTPQITAEAVIDSYHAIATIESEVADTVPKGKFWRCVIRTPGAGDETIDVVPVNGRTARFDGKPIS